MELSWGGQICRRHFPTLISLEPGEPTLCKGLLHSKNHCTQVFQQFPTPFLHGNHSWDNIFIYLKFSFYINLLLFLPMSSIITNFHICVLLLYFYYLQYLYLFALIELYTRVFLQTPLLVPIVKSVL